MHTGLCKYLCNEECVRVHWQGYRKGRAQALIQKACNLVQLPAFSYCCCYGNFPQSSAGSCSITRIAEAGAMLDCKLCGTFSKQIVAGRGVVR
ncbi:hypothetical protein XELAEV_18043006mg [Xenopus laevis]|uniref:Uncharacterized protein n=1 Tax=Xenopus laevis TaxID=8355 RepID=A0A974H6V9_XENLA|nr:hypothetical protein XELAEV_18043006mg [Xenopus laevis]